MFMISGVITNPSTLAALESRQKTDPTVTISQANPSRDSRKNEGTTAPKADDSNEYGAPDTVSLSREGQEAAASGQPATPEKAEESAKAAATSMETPAQDTATDPALKVSTDPPMERTLEYSKLLKQDDRQQQQQSAQSLGDLNGGSILNMVA